MEMKEKPGFSDEELRYITRNLIDIGTIMEKAGVSDNRISGWIEASAFPEPTYITPDGRRWYPKYTLVLVERSLRDNLTPKEEFIQDAVKVLDKPGYVYRLGNVEAVRPGNEEIEKMWKDFKSGLYGACLRRPTPENILSKGDLINKIKQLMENPDPNSQAWKESLKRYVKNLDEIEARFTDYDRERFGGKVSRDTFISEIMEKYPEVFSAT